MVAQRDRMTQLAQDLCQFAFHLPRSHFVTFLSLYTQACFCFLTTRSWLALGSPAYRLPSYSLEFTSTIYI